MGVFKGFANFGIGGVLAPPALAIPETPNQGLAMPTPVDRGALSTDPDGRKVALPPYGGEYLLLPNYMFIGGAVTIADLHFMRYDASGSLSWDWDKTDLTAEGISVSSGAGYLGFYLDVVDEALFVYVGDAFYSGAASDIVLAKILYDASGTISQSNGTQVSAAYTASTPTGNTRVAKHMKRNGDGTGAFTVRAHGYSNNNPINEGAVSTIFTTSNVATAGGLANYENADGTIFLESWDNTYICLRKGGVSRSIATSAIPNGVPTFAGGVAPNSVGAPTAGTSYPTPSNATRGPGIFVMPWGANEVVLCGLSTESIFGERYYKRNEFDAWLANLCTFIGI